MGFLPAPSAFRFQAYRNAGFERSFSNCNDPGVAWSVPRPHFGCPDSVEGCLFLYHAMLIPPGRGEKCSSKESEISAGSITHQMWEDFRETVASKQATGDGDDVTRRITRNLISTVRLGIP